MAVQARECWRSFLAVLVVVAAPTSCLSQTSESDLFTAPTPSDLVTSFAGSTEPVRMTLTSAGCSTCGSASLPPPDSGPIWMGDGCQSCGRAGCAPGRTPCPPCEAETRLGRFFYRVYESFCCVDPCYEPTWLPIADSAYFVDAVRPVTTQRARWDADRGMRFPDRSEYFWARADGKGMGPKPPSGVLGESGLSYNEISLYTEAAVGNAGMFVEMPYRAVYPDHYPFAAGFSDMNLGMKSLLLDSDLLLAGMQFRTFLPIGQARRGLGTGHVSLEPSLLLAVKFTPDTCLQAQVSEWIPVGGNRQYQGSILHYHASLNHVVGRVLERDPIIGTLELSGWSFQTGQYTDPSTGIPTNSSNDSNLSLGCGIRVFFCQRIDFGFGATFALSDDRWAKQFYRSELRWRF